MRNKQAVIWGVVFGFYCYLIIVVLRGGLDDYTNILRPAALANEPYGAGLFYWYPPWNTYLLELLGLLPTPFALTVIWGFSILMVLALTKKWNTPSWVVLMSPVFLNAIVVVCPFEALFFLGVTLIALGNLTALGLCLVLFKPQLALLVVPLVVARKGLKSLSRPLGMAIGVTWGDYLVTGRLWLIPWWENLQRVPTGSAYNVSLWPALGSLSLLWVPLGIWLLVRVRGNFKKELWVATTGSLLLSPYWGAYSLWPLIAMAGSMVMPSTNSVLLDRDCHSSRVVCEEMS